MNPKSLPDTRLVALARAGEGDAFGELIRRYRPLARRLVASLIRNEETARELVQEALLQAFLSLDRLRRDDHFPGWLAGVARNVCRDHVRRQASDPLEGAASLYWAFEGAVARPVHESSHEPFERAATREREQIVWAAVQGLSPKNREAVVLFYYERRSLAEIAAALGVSVAAVKGRLDKARRALRPGLGHLGVEELGELFGVRSTDRRVPAAPSGTRRKGKAMIEVDVLWVSHFGDDPLLSESPLTSERHARQFVLATLVSPSPGYSRDHVLLMDEARLRVVPLDVGGWAVTEAIIQGRSVREAGGASRPAFEADAARSLAYDLMLRLLDAAGGVVESVRIDVAEDIPYATVMLKRRTGTKGTGSRGNPIGPVRARPGDALALAAQAGCAVYASDAVMGGADAWSLADAPEVARRLGEVSIGDAVADNEASAAPLASLRAAATTEPLIRRVTGGIVERAIRFLRRRSDADEVTVVLERRPGVRGYVTMRHQAGGGAATTNVPMPPALLPIVIARFKTLAGLDLSPVGLSQTGQASVLHEGQEYDLFVTTRGADPVTETAAVGLTEGKTEEREGTNIGEKLTLRLRAGAVTDAVTAIETTL